MAKKLKESFSFEIFDNNGNSATHGSEIIVYLPEVSYGGEYIEDFYAAAKTVRAKLILRLSGGLFIKILEVIEDDGEGECDRPVKVGEVKQFRRQAWEWKVV